MSTVVIASFRFRHEAEMAKGFLTDAGIDSIVVVDDLGGLRPDIMTFQPARLLVHETDRSRAQEILKQNE